MADLDKPRRYRVSLAVHVFAQIEVTASSPELAAAIAQAEAKGAPRNFITSPIAYRVEKQVRALAGDAGSPLVWVEVEKS